MLILLLSSCAFAPAPNDAAKELASLQGKWIVWGREQSGSYSELGQQSQSFVTIKDDLYTLRTNAGQSYRISIVRPGAIDLFPNDKPFKGERWEGIYKVEGDKLTICHAMGDVESVKRPTQLKTGKEPHILYVLKRIKD